MRQAQEKRAGITARLRAVVRWSCVGLAVALMGWAIVMGAQHADSLLRSLLEVRQVTVEGLKRIDRQEVIDLVGLEPGTLLHQIVPSELEKKVKSHPWIKEATVTPVPFHELRISVIERVPAAVVRAGSENFLIDGEGHVLSLLSQADEESLPFVTGIDRMGLVRGDANVRRVIMSGIEMAKLMGQAYGGRFQVDASDPTNLVALVQGVRFHFGEGAIQEQWDRFQQVKTAVKALDIVDGSGEGGGEVDLRYENRVIVREGG